MATEIPVQSLAAIATLLASLIAGAVSFVSLTMTKEQKTSEFRQAWIDGLREELATFFACARAFARACEAKHTLKDDYKEKASFPITDEKISDIRFQVAEVHYRIKLRLNQEEVDHLELLRLMGRAVTEQNAMIENKTNASATLKAIEAAADFAPPLLKKEWIRVKKGELLFRATRNIVAPGIFCLSLAFIALIWFGNFKALS